jgi:hypothetical protein
MHNLQESLGSVDRVERDRGAIAATAKGVSYSSEICLSYVAGFAMLAVLLYMAGLWELLAISRLLDPLIEGGFVQYHDLGPGFIPGLPEVGLYFQAIQPIDWRLVGVAFACACAYLSIKALQFHFLASSEGSQAGVMTHLKMYYFSDGIDQFMPFNIGRMNKALSLMRIGFSEEKAYRIVSVQSGLLYVEICFFALLALFLLGWAGFMSQAFYAVLCLAAILFMIRNTKLYDRPGQRWKIQDNLRSLYEFAEARPSQAAWLVFLSLLAMFMFDLLGYLTMTAFDTEIVLINIDKPVLLMAVVAAYIAARIVVLTPGGWGQWELGFAAALAIGGIDVSGPLMFIGFASHLIFALASLLLMWMSSRESDAVAPIGETVSAFFSVPAPKT